MPEAFFMRVTPAINSTGEFWLPEAPARKVTGTLLIEDGARIRLELFDTLWDFAKTLTFDGEIPRLYGLIEDARAVLLEGCFFESRGLSFKGPAKSRLYVSRAYLSDVHGSEPTPAFTWCAFRVEGFEEWHGLSGLNLSFEESKQTTQVVLKNPEDILLWSDKEARLEIEFTPGMFLRDMPREITLRQHSRLKLSFSSSQPLERIAQLVNQLQQFLSFGIDATVSIVDLQGYSPESAIKLTDGGTANRPVAIYFDALLHGDKPPKIEQTAMFFRWDDIKHRADNIIDAWRAAHSRLGPAMNLYFSARTDPYRYLNVRFMFLIQALETFHRRMHSETLMPEADFNALKKSIKEQVPKVAWEYLAGRLTYGNELGLGKRVQRLIEPFTRYFGDADAQKRFVQTVVDTRNFYTHFDQRLAERAADGGALHDVCERLEALFQLQLAKAIGFSDMEIDGLVSRHPRILHKLSVLRDRLSLSSVVARAGEHEGA